MALFDDTSFTSIALPTPIGYTGNPVYASDPVTMLLSDSQNVTVFNSVTTALKCMEFMRQRGQYMLQASDDIAIITTGQKLILLEMTLHNQKLMSSYVASYQGGRTIFVHRSMSLAVTLDQALSSVGFAKLTSAAYAGNIELAEGSHPPRIKLVDWFYCANPTTNPFSQGTRLNDATPINYDFV